MIYRSFERKASKETFKKLRSKHDKVGFSYNIHRSFERKVGKETSMELINKQETLIHGYQNLRHYKRIAKFCYPFLFFAWQNILFACKVIVCCTLIKKELI